MTINYDKLPESLRGAMKRYIENAIRPGDFLQAVLRNDLLMAVFRADDNNFKELRNIMWFCHNEIPGKIWGSSEKMENWIATRKDDKE